MLSELKKRAGGFIRDDSGVVAIIFALSLPMFIAAAGVAVDLAQAYNMKSRLAAALDKAALAGGSTAELKAEVEERITSFFEANYPADKLGTPYGLVVEVGDDALISVSAHARVDTTFMEIFGVSNIEVFADSIVKREIRGLEVVMVLDNTGSMATAGNINILKTAAKNFTGILFDAASDPENIKIGMVPFSTTVRVGRYGIGLKPDGSVYGDGSKFVTLPSGVSYTSSSTSSTGWFGCVVEHKSGNYSAAATHVSNSYGQLWKTAASCTTNTNCRGHGWDANVTSNDPYPNDAEDSYQGPWDIYMYGTVTKNCSGTCNPKYTFNKDSKPNRYCPQASILPLTSDEAAIKAQANLMTADGNTVPSIGMIWGARVLSPEPPFTEGVDWDDEDWRKAVLLMTDGDTNMGGDSTAYWFDSKNGISNTQINQRMVEICDDLKSKGVTIYTVLFEYDDGDISQQTKDYYKSCASSDEYYFEAPSQDELVEAFEKIAHQLANLHIVE